MANRKEVFQEKLLKRLYPVPPKSEKPQAALTNPGSVCEKACAKVKSIRGRGTAEEGRNKPLQTRVYTVLPPPEGYRAGEGESATLPEPRNVDTEDVPAVEAGYEKSPEPSEGGHQRRRRRKKRRHGAAGGGGGERGVEEESKPDGAREVKAKTTGGEAKMGRNRRRKEKKRRHRERLLVLGLTPGAAAAVEFTYQPGPAEEEEADEEEGRGGEERLAELLDFLQATREICLSDRGAASVAARVPDAVMEGLSAGLGAGAAPPADRARLRHLLALALRRDAGGLAAAMEEYRRASAMPPVETSAVCSLFGYWLTDILPVQSDLKPTGSPAPTPATYQEPAW